MELEEKKLFQLIFHETASFSSEVYWKKKWTFKLVGGPVCRHHADKIVISIENFSWTPFESCRSYFNSLKHVSSSFEWWIVCGTRGYTRDFDHTTVKCYTKNKPIEWIHVKGMIGISVRDTGKFFCVWNLNDWIIVKMLKLLMTFAWKMCIMSHKIITGSRPIWLAGKVLFTHKLLYDDVDGYKTDILN